MRDIHLEPAYDAYFDEAFVDSKGTHYWWWALAHPKSLEDDVTFTSAHGASIFEPECFPFSYWKTHTRLHDRPNECCDCPCHWKE